MISVHCLYIAKNIGMIDTRVVQETTGFIPHLVKLMRALTDIQATGGNSSTEGLQSYIGRVNYTAFSKYLLEGNFRVDGSSKFLPGSQYGFFPSVAVGWRFTEENFIKAFTEKFLTNGKLRVSYGSAW